MPYVESVCNLYIFRWKCCKKNNANTRMCSCCSIGALLS